MEEDLVSLVDRHRYSHYSLSWRELAPVSNLFFWHFPPWMPPGRGVLSMFYCEEAPGQRQDTLEKLYLSASLGIPQCSPG